MTNISEFVKVMLSMTCKCKSGAFLSSLLSGIGGIASRLVDDSFCMERDSDLRPLISRLLFCSSFLAHQQPWLFILGIPF